MSSPSFNNGEDNAGLLQEELEGEGVQEVDMEGDEGNSLGVHPPAFDRGTLAGISTRPNPHQAMRSSNNQASLEV